jgi:hypothetical protein
MPNRIQLDIQGTVYTFPINPIDYDPQASESFSLVQTVDGSPVRFTPFFDGRKRTMRWRSLPNRTPYDTLIPNLRASIGVSGVRIKHNDLSIDGNDDVWKTIRVENVIYRYKSGAGPATATGKLAYDIDFIFTYTHDPQ